MEGWTTAYKSEFRLLCCLTETRPTDRNNRGAFDISFFAAVASHLAYWTDEDVCHFMLSQMLSHRKKVRASRSFETVGQAADQTV